jgi:Zn-dependent M28 family amino/carboxypeptidase
MRKIIFTGLLSVVLLSCSGTKNIEKEKEKKTNDATASFMNTITAADLKTHLTVIASDEMQGRNTGEEGQNKAAEYIVNHYSKNGITFPSKADGYFQKVPSEFMKSRFSPKLNDSKNIWVYIEGSELPDELIVVSAHYDHVGVKNGEIYNGADDDGSGTVAVMELAQAFNEAAKAGNRPKRSILFLHVTGEEHGLHGSRYYSEFPLFPLANTVANVNIDMIGRRDDLNKNSNKYVYVIGSDYLSTDLYNITEEANKKYTNLKLDYKYNDKKDPNRYYYRSDHYNFAKNGIPCVFLFNGVHADYHQPTDDVEKIEFDALETRARLAFAITWELANRDTRIVVDKVDKD